MSNRQPLASRSVGKQSPRHARGSRRPQVNVQPPQFVPLDEGHRRLAVDALKELLAMTSSPYRSIDSGPRRWPTVLTVSFWCLLAVAPPVVPCAVR